MADIAAPIVRSPASDAPALVTYDTHPDRYAHWKLTFDGTVATLALDVNEDRGLRPGYKLKLNSYDLGVDIELHDALQRIRFEHPEVRAVVVTSAKERIFCSGANIFMLGVSSHAWKVNFCKFTNETRNGIEDSSRHSGLKFVAACNGTTAGGGYELALACDEIWLVDDRSSAVSLPEVPLLGVLPGTGGLTRVTDKRHVRRDRADVFCTLVEGVRAQRAKEWRLIDGLCQAAAVRRDGACACRGACRVERSAGRRQGCRAYAARAHDRPEWLSLRIRRRRVRPDGAQRDDHGEGAGVCTGRRNRRDRCTRRRMVAARDGARARRRDPHAANERARPWHVAAEDAGRARARARRRRSAEKARRPLVRPRDDRHAAANARAARRHVAHVVCADRAGLVLRRHAARARARRRSQLHARVGRRRRERTGDRAVGRQTSAAIRW